MRISAILIILLAAIPGFAAAQGPAAETAPGDTENAQSVVPAGDGSADVWAVVEAQWNAEAKGDSKWLDNLLADDFSGWSNESPAPRNKSSTKMWDRYTDSLGSMKAHELYPLAIIVRGDTAIAHYLYSSAYEDKDGEVEMTSGRYTDVLVRTDDGWKFIGWHGGADPDAD